MAAPAVRAGFGPLRQAAPRVTSLRLTDFRNHHASQAGAVGAIVAIIGENGAGKTNILEALSLLMPGRGLRRADLATMARQGATGFSVVADVEGAFGHARLATGLLAGEAGRQCRIDREPVPSANAFLDHLRLVWLTPDMDSLFRGPAGDRRRFLDRLVTTIDPGHSARVSAFEKLLRERNRVLEAEGDRRWLDALEGEIAQAGVAVASGRLGLVAHLARFAEAMRAERGPFPHAVVALGGEVESRLAHQTAAEVEDWFAMTLRAQRPRDAAAGRALVGPQTSDLLLRHGPKDMEAALCSTGEQKALLIGLILAHAELTAEIAGQVPILLLDEIAAHLDAARRAALFGRLAGLGGQVWMTGTEAALFADAPGGLSLLAVANGAIIPVRA